MTSHTNDYLAASFCRRINTSICHCSMQSFKLLICYLTCIKFSFKRKVMIFSPSFSYQCNNVELFGEFPIHFQPSVESNCRKLWAKISLVNVEFSDWKLLTFKVKLRHLSSIIIFKKCVETIYDMIKSLLSWLLWCQASILMGEIEI